MGWGRIYSADLGSVVPEGAGDGAGAGVVGEGGEHASTGGLQNDEHSESAGCGGEEHGGQMDGWGEGRRSSAVERRVLEQKGEE